jgi:hypothetical protein
MIRAKDDVKPHLHNPASFAAPEVSSPVLSAFIPFICGHSFFVLSVAIRGHPFPIHSRVSHIIFNTRE